jgi:predicted acyl esterase
MTDKANLSRTMLLRGKDGKEFEVPVRPGLPVTAATARYPGFKQETLILKKGSIRMKGSMPLPCDILLERDVPLKLRDGVTIYTDVFRPVDGAPCPAILALSPYGKEIGSQWLDDVPMRAGVPKKATSGLQKFEGPDPAYWVNQGYAVINPDVRGAYNSEGVVLFFGSDYGRDGADIVEWAAAQDWCNGKVGMSGNSWLAISQWFTAAQNPPHLAAIAPWEGLNDCYREVATRGGVLMTEFVKFLTESFATTESGGIEDTMSTMNEYPLMNEYWGDKTADLEAITVPAYIVASYNNQIHTNGTFEGYNRISSTEKWLRVHNTSEWPDYYDSAHVEDLRKFFDHYLKGIDNGWGNTPKVRLSVLNPGGKDIIDRVESEWPLARTEYKKLYLNAANGRLSGGAISAESSVSYDSDGKKPSVTFKIKFAEDTEITGYMKLRLWVQSPDNDDMDIAVKIDKLNKFGFKPFSLMDLMMPTAATGYMRVSLRELDPQRSTEQQPYQMMTHEQKLGSGEIVPVDIGIWPMGMLFKKGETLRVTISPYKTPTGGFAIPFGQKPIQVPAEGFTYMPGEKPQMLTLGTGAKVPAADVEMPKDHNKGRHVFYAGGQYDSYLYVPVIPEK